MIEITMKIDGMMCGMCEAHINDTIRKQFQVKKVTSSHGKEETKIITETDISDEVLKKTVEKTGYRVLSISRNPYAAKGLLKQLHR